ncbi:methyl-accepting chemotaxis protein [Rheinheimera marina]|uniref:Methyl-accepting chemotaxis protein n=1 Tax=Rheinheimera marina TaxID=1774958 RepID=A0ABV9JNL9_9GAMM
MVTQKIGLAGRLAIAFAIPLSLLVLIAVLSVWSLNSMQAGLRTVYLDRVVPLEGLKRIADLYAVSVIDAVNKANAGLFSSDEALEQVKMAQQGISSEWKAYMATTMTVEEAQLARQAEQLFVAADQDIRTLQNFLQQNSADLSGKMTDFDGPLYQSIDPISSKVTELVDLQLRVAENEFKKAENLYQQNLWLIAIMALLAIAGSVAAAYRVVHNTLGHLGGEPEYAAMIVRRVANGELNLTIDLKQQTGNSLLHNLGAMVQQLRGIVIELKQSSDALDQAAHELAVSSEQSTQQLMMQYREVDGVSTAMNEMSSSVADVAHSAAQAATNSEEAEAGLRNSAQVMAKTQSAVSELSSQVQVSTDLIGQLSAHSEQIGQVVDVIRGVAEQTNLLALNAAIEAARAGEQGRGFAVVADEVRTLASRTQDSTAAIQQMISTLYQGVQSTVAAMKMNQQHAGVMLDLVGDSQQVFNGIRQSMAQIQQMNGQIASAAEQQSHVSEEINRNLMQIKGSAELSAAASEQVSRASVELSQIANRLTGHVNFFKLA